MIWQSWDEDEVIVFNRSSGDTHLLDAFSAAVLREIEARPAGIAELCRQLGLALDLPDSAIRGRVVEVCAQLQAASLADPVAC